MNGSYRARSLHDGVKPGFRAVVDNPNGWPTAHCMTLGDAEQIAAALNATPPAGDGFKAGWDACEAWWQEGHTGDPLERYREAFTTPSQGLDAATVERCDCIDLEALTYDELWQAIADATKVEAGAVSISVVKFREAIRALATDPHQHGGKGA